MIDPHFQPSPAEQQSISQQKMEAIKLLMDQTLSNPDMENINKLKDIMGVLSEPPTRNVSTD
jgi:hypothetical protein